MYLCTDVEIYFPFPLLGYTRKKRSKLNYHAFSLNIFVAFFHWPWRDLVRSVCLPACRVVMGVIKSKKVWHVLLTDVAEEV